MRSNTTRTTRRAPRFIRAAALLSSASALVISGGISIGCGGSTPKPPVASESDERAATPEEAEAATHTCGSSDKTQVHDLHSGTETKSFVPCGSNGKHDYSGLIRIETVENGVHIIIDARDDEVELLGKDVRQRDAVIVFPRGKDAKYAVEVPLTKTKTGYHGDKIVFWDELDKLSDEGTKIDIKVYDHDKKSGQPAEELHVSVTISAGKSCEKAQDENPQQVDMGKKDGRKDLTKDELGAPIAKSNAAVACGLADSSHASICVVVKNGKPLGVSVGMEPKNNKVAACIDRRMRGLAFPSSDKPDVVTYHY
jgi:hypothetical protein